MAAIHRLTHLKASKTTKPGVYEDGGGLRLVVGLGETRRWVVRVTSQGRRRERGLGSFPVISLDEARSSAAEFRSHAKQGRDLAFELKIAAAKSTTFKQAFKAFYDIKSKTLSNEKHAKQWQSSLETYVFPKVGARPVAEVAAAEVLQVLSPIWFSKPETARRVLQRMEAVFKSAILRGSRTLASPCIGVVQELGTRHRTVNHHISLPWSKIPVFLAELKTRKCLPSTRLGLEFLILTAARSGEVRGSLWRELSLADKEWRIPASRMKGRAPHTVPLSSRAIEILQEIRTLHPESECVFPSASGAPLSEFKVWAAEVAKVRDEVREACLAHKIPGKVRAAYLRTDFIEERRSVMQAWAIVLASSKRKLAV